MMKGHLPNRALFHSSDLRQEFISQSGLTYTLSSLVAKGMIVRIKGGLYATVNPITGGIFANRFEIATALHDGASVAYHSALEFHGLGNQMYSEVHAFAPKRVLPFTYNGLEYKFFAFNHSCGVMTLEQNDTIRVTDLERTIVDCIDRIDLAGGIEELMSALSGITYLDENKLSLYLDDHGERFLYKKTGYFLSLLHSSYVSESFYQSCKAAMSPRIDSIVENRALPQVLDKEWNLLVPRDLINEEN